VLKRCKNCWPQEKKGLEKQSAEVCVLLAKKTLLKNVRDVLWGKKGENRSVRAGKRGRRRGLWKVPNWPGFGGESPSTKSFIHEVDTFFQREREKGTEERVWELKRIN